MTEKEHASSLVLDEIKGRLPLTNPHLEKNKLYYPIHQEMLAYRMRTLAQEIIANDRLPLEVILTYHSKKVFQPYTLTITYIGQ